MQIKDSTQDKDKLYVYFIPLYYSHSTSKCESESLYCLATSIGKQSTSPHIVHMQMSFQA